MTTQIQVKVRNEETSQQKHLWIKKWSCLPVAPRHLLRKSKEKKLSWKIHFLNFRCI